MISEINALEKYADFINDITGDPRFSDPHFKYDKGNLYDAPGKKNHKIFTVLNGEALKQNQPHGMMVLVDTDAFDEIRIYEAAGFERVEGQNSMYATYTS